MIAPISETEKAISSMGYAGFMATPGSAAQVQAVGRDHAFHPLRIARVVRETPDASSFVLEVPPALNDAFAYRAGQFVTHLSLIHI